MERKRGVKLNIIISLVSQLLALIINYLTKKALFTYLGADYMGVQVVFGNICDILTIAFSGIGVVMLARMYPAIAGNDTMALTAIRRFFDRVSRKLSLITGAFAVPAVFAAIWLTASDIPVKSICFYYIIYLLAILVYSRFRMDYYFLMGDERLFVSCLVYGLVDLASLGAQILILQKTENYLLFLICILAKNIIECAVLRIIIHVQYKKVCSGDSEPDKEEKRSIIKDMKYVVLSRVGDILMFSTDSMIISKVINLGISGLYSNYFFVLSGIYNAVFSVFDAIMARVGNINVSASLKTKRVRYFRLCSFNIIMTAICVNGLYLMTEPFIELWMGEKAVLGHFVVILTAMELYLQVARRSIAICRMTEGMFKEITAMIIIRGVLNVILSVILGIIFGLGGILASTVISDIATVYWFEPYIVHKRLGTRLRYELCYQLVSLGSVILSLSLSALVIGFIDLGGWGGFILKSVLVALTTGVSLLPVSIIMLIIIRKLKDHCRCPQ